MSTLSQSVFYGLARGGNHAGPDLWYVTKTVISTKHVYTVLASKGFVNESNARAKMHELEANLEWEEYTELFKNIYA